MIKQNKILLVGKKIILASCLLISSVFATDYSSMTLDEMISQKGTIAQEDRDAFRAEMQSKMQNLTPEQKAELRASNTRGQGQMKKQQTRDGSGSRNRYGGSQGKGRR